MTTLVSFIIVLGLLIFVHEFGHFLLAKLFGVRVLKFSLGFGPSLAGTKIGETEYVLSAIPLGGYVKMFGENPAEQDVDPADVGGSFAAKPVWQRFLIVAGGPVFNLLFAGFLFFVIFSINGLPVPVDTTKIGAVSEKSPAAEAGLLAGDEILALSGTAIERWEELSERIREGNGEPVIFQVRRNDEVLEFSVTPTMSPVNNIFNEEVEKRYLVGITRAEEVVYEKISLARAVTAGGEQVWSWIYLTVMGIVKIIQKVVPASELGGPILIAQLAGKQMEAGWVNFLYFMAVISVNLGVLNLLPIPILDGGHLVFFSVEAILRRPLSIRVMERFQQVGMIMLGALMIFAFYNDIARFFR